MPRPKTSYKVDGKRVCGVTTPIGIIWESYKSDNMLDWATRLALDNTYWKWERNRKGLTGTLTHSLCIGYVVDEDVSIEEYKQDYLYCDDVLVRSLKLYGKFRTWYDRNPFTVLEWEKPMVHTEHRYGGTPDMKTNDTIIDLKTGFVDEYSCGLQLAGYAELHHHLYQGRMKGQIIGFDKNDDVKTVDYSVKDLEELFHDFLKIKDIYYSKQQFSKGRTKR